MTLEETYRAAAVAREEAIVPSTCGTAMAVSTVIKPSANTSSSSV
jgi:hypothetical protein